jgi:hypothetical protein
MDLADMAEVALEMGLEMEESAVMVTKMMRFVFHLRRGFLRTAFFEIGGEKRLEIKSFSHATSTSLSQRSKANTIEPT